MKIPHFGLKRQYENLKDELLDATHRALKDGQLVNGHYARSFEEWLKHRCQTKYAVTVHSCTQALEIMAEFVNQYTSSAVSSKIQIPNFTYPATLNAFLSKKFEVELLDTDKYGIMKFDILTKSLKCIVGLYGMQPWKYSLYPNETIIIDGAQHWLVADGKVGLGMAISFDPTKNLPSSGNGGAIVTNNEHLYLFASRYKDNCKPYFESIGTNTKMSEQDCAQILVRTKYIDKWQNRRQQIAQYWCDNFKNLPITCLNATTEPHAHQKFVLYMSDRNSFHTNMLLEGIDTKISYEYTLGDLPISANLVKPGLLSTSVMLSKGVISLPIYPELTDNEVAYICDKIIKYFDK